ncbi:NitT/TauT family transport system ATP-binding protein [Shimia isoporae]|uniref:NitT/TauT family transport system ATP-binding protein n=1 Tax=Shimia isoporae TaxID=647720 RepID=A0A4V2Q220_9RHOB|nr:ABC transporter substrate-binding protein [Shimia isoporae]TCL00444.1 NitT/TauT family transport system ATP-binding protein [Shimia isoporae]
MRTLPLSVGFMPLVDAAPLIVAHELGFAEEEGLALNLQSAPSWSTLRDRLILGQIEAAHMLSPVPVAMALGLGGLPTQLDALSVLSINGNVIGISNALADQLSNAAKTPDFLDATAAGQALAGLKAPLRVGVPFPFSMHAELLHYWLAASGLNTAQALDVRTIPPPLMADAIATGEVDAFCVGEPWGSITVENGGGALLLPGAAIWQFAPEKVLAVRRDWANAEDDLTGRLMRAVWKAGRWLGQPDKRTTAADILGWPEYLGVSTEIIERAFSGDLLINARGKSRHVPRMMEFYDGAATFPWKSQGAWIGARMAARFGLDRAASATKAAAVFRSDLYRRHLGPLGADLPAASKKLEGALSGSTTAATDSGHLILGPDRFFDGQVFDPSHPEC